MAFSDLLEDSINPHFVPTSLTHSIIYYLYDNRVVFCTVSVLQLQDAQEKPGLMTLMSKPISVEHSLFVLAKLFLRVGDEDDD